MTANLHDQLAEAEATAERLRREIASASCAIVGHDWKHPRISPGRLVTD